MLLLVRLLCWCITLVRLLPFTASRTLIPSTTFGPTVQITLLPPTTLTNHTVYCRGAFFCRYHYEPYSEAKIRLLSNIRYLNEKPRVQHIVDGTETLEDGSFEVGGVNRDNSSAFEPVLVVYHQCAQSRRKNETYHRFVIKAPSVFVDSNETFDIGRLNLDLIYPGQNDHSKFQHFTKPMRIVGELFCPDQPNVARIVRLFSSLEEDAEHFITEQTLEDMAFKVDSGKAKLEEPMLQIIHQCDMPTHKISKGLYRHFIIRIPFFYYNAGRVGLRDFNIGKLGLQPIYPGEFQRELREF